MAWACVAGLTLLAACDDADSAPDNSGASESATNPNPDAALSFALDDGTLGKPVRSVENAGTERAVIDVVSAHGGAVRLVDRQGEPALRFPAYDPKSKAVAMIRVRPADSDWMSPGTDPFSFGVDVRLDAKSSGSDRDNGDNVLQRGLFGDAQLKVQLDKRIPSCVVTGDQGMVLVKGKAKLDSKHWYRVDCARDGDKVTLDVARLDANGEPQDAARSTGSGQIGSVDFLPGVSMSVGGKITEDGKPAAATDQFNGTLRGVYFSAEA